MTTARPFAAAKPFCRAPPLPKRVLNSKTLTLLRSEFFLANSRTTCGVESLPSKTTTISKLFLRPFKNAATPASVGAIRFSSLYAGITIETSMKSHTKHKQKSSLQNAFQRREFRERRHGASKQRIHPLQVLARFAFEPCA